MALCSLGTSTYSQAASRKAATNQQALRKRGAAEKRGSVRRALKPDAQAFDEVRIVTVPRYKTSGMSGDEWRISARIEFYRKGQKIHEAGFRDIEKACVFAAAEYYSAIDDGKAYFAGEGDLCDQEGCAEKATVTYKMKQEFCRSGHASNPYEFDKAPLIRRFCERHSTRGDCGLDDADANYERLEGVPAEPRGEDVRHSVFGGILTVDPTESN